MLTRGAAAYGIRHKEACDMALKQLRRTPMASFTTMILIAIALILPVLFWFFTAQLKPWVVHWQNTGHLSLYLKADVSTQAAQTLLKQIQQRTDVSAVHYISSEEGLHLLERQAGMKAMLGALPENPLPAVIDVMPLPQLSAVKIESMAQAFHAYPEVLDVKLDREWLSRLTALFLLLNRLSHGLIFLFGVSLLFIVGNALRFNIQKRHEDIEILKLVGAKDTFIMRPFLYMGIFLGLGGACLALMIVSLFLFYLSSSINTLMSLYHGPALQWHVDGGEMVLFILSMIGLSGIGAWYAVKRELRRIDLIP